MPTGGKGGASGAARQRARRQRALRQLQEKARRSRVEAKRTQAAAQHVNEPKVKAQHERERKLIREYEAHPHAQEARFGPSPHLVEQTLSDLADAAIHAPGGAVAIGKAVGKDVYATRRTSDHPHPDLSFKRSRKIGKGLAQSTAEDFRHPLRHPGFTLLDAFAALSAGTGTGARIGAASRAARAGKVGAAAKALVKAPKPGTRTYKLGDLEVATPNSKNALVRGIQKTHARRVNKSEDEGRKAKVVGKHLLQKERAVNAVERAPSEALNARGRKLSTPQETALRVVHEETPIAERVAFHEGRLKQAKRGSQQFVDHRHKLLLLKAAEKYVHDANGKPELRPKYKRLGEVSHRIDVVNAQRERILGPEGTADLSPEQIAQRRAAPGRVIRGAHYEKPTPAKMGRPSPQLERQRGYVERLEGLHERALERAGRKAKPYPPVTVKVPAGEKTVTREMGLDEAQKRLAELDKKYEQALKKITPHVDPFGGAKIDTRRGEMSVKQYEQMRRNTISGKSKRKMQTVSAEVRELAEQRIDALVKKHPEQQFAKDVLERERLREAIGEHKLVELGGETNGKPSFGRVTETVKTKSTSREIPSDLPAPNVLSNPIATRLGGALSVARGRLAAMEKAAAKRRKPVGLVGAEDFEGGRSRIPYTRETGKITGRQSEYRGGVPRKPGSLTHPFTGGLVRSANFRDKTSRLVAEAGIEAQRRGDLLRLRDSVLKASVEKLPAENPGDYIAVRVKNVPKPPELKNLESKVEEGVKLTRSERQVLSDSFENWKQQMFAEPTELSDYKGYRFVRREALAKINQPRLLANVAHYKALRGVGHVVSETNNAVRTALLYLAPKYAVPNIGGNVALTVSQQSLRAIPNFYRVLKVVDRDPDLAAKFRSAMGEGFSRQLEATQGITRRASEPLAHAWSKIVDEKFRESALLHELQELGFKTRDELHAAFDDPHNQPRMVEAIQRARESIGDYDRLGPVEKDIVRHAIFFYTWLKVSTRLSKMFLVDRPIQSAGIVNLGKLGEQKQREELGDLPSYMAPLFKVAGSKEHPVVSNASALNVFTAADLTKSLLNFARGEHNQSGYQVADNLSPFFSLAVAAITGRDPFTQRELHGNLGDVALNQLTGGLPQVALRKRLERAKGDQSERAYTYTPGQAVAQFGLGPLGPHGLNPAPVHELAAKEHLADVPPAQRSRITVFQRRQAFYEAAKAQDVLDNGRLPKVLRDSFNVEAARQSAYAGATHRANAKPGSAAYHLARLQVDARLLARLRHVDGEHAQQMLRWADEHKDDIDALKSARRYLSETYYQADGGFLDTISQWRRWLEEHGGKDLG